MIADFLAESYYRLKVPLFEWKEQRWVSRHFYHDPFFKTVDQEVLSGPNPYPIAHVFPYGETPLRVLYAIGKAAQLQPTDHFVDLGCGRGRAVFFISHVFGCRATGIDLTPAFIQRAQHIAKKHQLEKVSFSCEDFLQTHFQSATCIYLYGTTYSDECIQALEGRLQHLPARSRVITVSAPLPHFCHQHQMSHHFPWGPGELFLHFIQSAL